MVLKLGSPNDSIATINDKLISIVERGTKNNYNYTKYSNGDMVMWSKYTWNTNLATSWYNWYFASSAAVGFPVAFNEAPLIIVSPAKTNELYGLGVTESHNPQYNRKMEIILICSDCNIVHIKSFICVCCKIS